MAERQRALNSLSGLSVGDAFGERFFGQPAQTIEQRQLPPAPWSWTDDTQMALSIVEVLLEHGSIEQDALASGFAERFAMDPNRGYGGGAIRLLARIHTGADWRVEAPRLFEGGSFGNGGAMRAAPIGGYFAGDPARAASEAQRSAAVTHAHAEGQAGAMAVAAAAALVGHVLDLPNEGLLELVLHHVPDGRTREGVQRSMMIPPEQFALAVSELGSGQHISAFDTVPFCLWIAAHHGGDFQQALWNTVAGGGDLDTTCAIVGGIVALGSGVPEAWLAMREPLPGDFAFKA